MSSPSWQILFEDLQQKMLEVTVSGRAVLSIMAELLMLVCKRVCIWLSEHPMVADAFVICCILFGLSALCIAASETAFRYSDGGKYKWITREWKLLRALIEDEKDVSTSASQIRKNARQYSDSDPVQDEIAVQVLNDREKGWITKAKRVVDEATLFIQNFEKLRERRKSLKWYVRVFFEPVLTVDAAFGMKWFEDKIRDNLGAEVKVSGEGKNVCAADVNESLEKSRSKIRSLLDRSSVDEIEFVKSTRLVGLSGDSLILGLILSLKNLMVDNQDLMRGMEVQMTSFRLHLQLLDAFMKDIKLQLKVVESKIEHFWVVEAYDTIEEAEAVIGTITSTMRAHQKQKRLMCRGLSRLSAWISNWIAKRKLKKDVMKVSTRIFGLLETKERYGIKFIRRDLSKSPHSSPHNPNPDPQQQTVDQHQLSPSVVIELIRNWLNQLQKRSSELVTHVNSLSKELEGMLGLLNDIKATEDCVSNLRTCCLEQLKNLAIKVHLEDTNRSPSKLLSELIIPIKHAVELVQRCIRVYSIEVRQDSCSVVGFEEDIDNLVSLLIDETTEHSSIICIEGMKGIGKTTLAKKVYYQETIAAHFHVLRWIPIPPVFKEKVLLAIVGKQVLQEKDTIWNQEKEYWINGMRNFLKEKRSLLVFDNVPSKEAWDFIKPAFSEISKGSKIVLITSTKSIALHVGENCIRYPIRLRTTDESWELFTQMVQYSPDDEGVESIGGLPLVESLPRKDSISLAKKHVESIEGLPLVESLPRKDNISLAKKHVESIGGLPLAIIHVGYQLWGKKWTPKKLSEELKRITKEQNHMPWLDNVAVNVVDLQLDPILSKCFSYFQHFSRDFEIPVRRIITSWVALGLTEQPSRDEKQVQTSTDGKGTPERIAYNNLIELISRNMIQVLQIKPNRMVRTCRLPTAVRDLLLKSGEGYGSETRSSPSKCLDDQLTFPFDDNDAHFQPNVMQNDKSCHPNCVLFFDNRTEIKPGEGIGEILQKGIDSGLFLQLQVLDLEGVLRPQLPKAIGTLKKLAYLGLRWTYLMTVPSSIVDLVNLQTLDLKHTHVRTLPSSVWKLKKLRHLYLNQNCRMLRPTTISMRKLPIFSGVIVQTPISMRNLQILSGLFVDKANLVRVRQLKFPYLRKLRLAFQLTALEQKVLQTWIAKLTNLESLKLRSINEKRLPQHLHLEPISHFKKLYSLHLFGKLANPSIIEKLPQSLTHLTLSASGIKEDPMPILGKLPNLRSLSLFSDSYEGKKLVCSKNGFPLLLVLKLWNLHFLENLHVAEAMQNLRKLENRSCRNLKIPPGLKHLTTPLEAEEQSAAAVKEQSAEEQ